MKTKPQLQNSRSFLLRYTRPLSTPYPLKSFKNRLDATRIGVGGHSFGAYTAMLLGGVTADLGGVKARRFADPRVRCILPISA
ncbi:MAG: hypothetical protein Fur0032_24870 [Terrimicrobiaceae bacterium]